MNENVIASAIINTPRMLCLTFAVQSTLVELFDHHQPLAYLDRTQNKIKDKEKGNEVHRKRHFFSSTRNEF